MHGKLVATQPRPRRIAVAALVATAAVGVGFARCQRLGAAGLASDAREARRARPLFPADIEQSYRIEYATHVVTTTGQPMTSFTLDGALRLVELSASPAVIVRGEFAGTVSAQVGQPEQAGGPAQGAAETSLAAAVRRPFVLEFGLDGSFRSARGMPGTPAFVARLWSALGEYLQVLRSGSNPEWQARETDASGVYVARYEQHTAGMLAKSKLRYETVTAKALTSYDVISSSSDFKLDGEERLESLALSETTKASLGSGPFPGFEATTTLDMHRTSVGSAGGQIVAWLQELARVVPLSQSARGESEQGRDRALIGGLSVAEALSRLRLFESPAAKHEDRTRAGRAFVALTALLRQDPSALGVVRANLEKKGPLTNSLLAALRDASTPEAQKLLTEMSAPGSPLDSEQRLEAARSLSRVSSPTAETVEALKSLRSDPDVGAQATYGLGSALHRLAEQDPMLAGEARTALTDQLAGAKTSGEQATVLTALGNSGDPSTLDTIREYLTSDSASVRAAVAQALRRIAGAEADQMLATLCPDPSADVRFSAVDAIGERAFSAVLANALSTLVVGEPQYQVRAKAVNILAQWLPDAPGVAAALTIVANRDPNPDLRNVATGALTK